jgi:hypothetical protein
MFYQVNLLASSVLHRDILLLIVIYQPIHINIARISFVCVCVCVCVCKEFSPNVSLIILIKLDMIANLCYLPSLIKMIKDKLGENSLYMCVRARAHTFNLI